MRGGRYRLLLGLVAMPLAIDGCAFEGQIAIGLSGSAPVLVKQSTTADLAPQHVEGTTTRAGQVVRIDCSVTGLYDVRDPTGPAVLAQLYVVHLRTRPLPRGTRYRFDCEGPVIMQLPADASAVQATATSASDRQVSLSVQAPVTSIAIAYGKRLRAQPGTQLAIVGAQTLSPGAHAVELAFSLPGARAFQEKILYAASIACGRSKYVQPIRPLVTGMSRVSPLTIQPSANPTNLSAPHLFGGIRAYGEATRTLSCAR